jgi:hypothetical protein
MPDNVDILHANDTQTFWLSGCIYFVVYWSFYFPYIPLVTLSCLLSLISARTNFVVP